MRKKIIRLKDKPLLECLKDAGYLIFQNYNHKAKIMFKFFKYD